MTSDSWREWSVSAGLGREMGSDPALGVEKAADQSPLSILDILFLPDKAFQPWRWEGFQADFINKETEVYGCTHEVEIKYRDIGVSSQHLGS